MDAEKAEIIKVEYERPTLVHRVLANFIDILLMVFVTIIMFIATRAIVQSTSNYRDNDLKYKTIELESGLFINTDDPHGNLGYKFGDQVQLLTYWLPRQDNLTYEDICNRCDAAIEHFFLFLDGYDTELSDKAELFYKESRLKMTGNIEGHEHYFVENAETGEIFIPVNESGIPYYSYKTYFEEYYKKTIDNNFIDDYLTKHIPNFKDYLSNEGKYVIFLEFPIAYVMGAILVYFIPPLFFRRGRKTLGNALYHIGLVDSRYYSPTFLRHLARFAIFLFAELILSIFTFGAPFIISFTMMLGTKSKQGFPDYLLRLNQIDTSKQKIYYNKIDALSDRAKNYKDPTDFKLPDNL